MAILRHMIKHALSLFLLRFLPRRLVPLLAVIQVVQLVRRLRRGTPDPVAPRRLVTVDGPARDAVPPVTRR